MAQTQTSTVRTTDSLLTQLRELVRQVSDGRTTSPVAKEFAELFASLDQWLSHGNALPAPWAGWWVEKPSHLDSSPRFDSLRRHLLEVHKNEAALGLSDLDAVDQHTHEHTGPGGLRLHQHDSLIRETLAYPQLPVTAQVSNELEPCPESDLGHPCDRKGQHDLHQAFDWGSWHTGEGRPVEETTKKPDTNWRAALGRIDEAIQEHRHGAREYKTDTDPVLDQIAIDQKVIDRAFLAMEQKLATQEQDLAVARAVNERVIAESDQRGETVKSLQRQVQEQAETLHATRVNERALDTQVKDLLAVNTRLNEQCLTLENDLEAERKGVTYTVVSSMYVVTANGNPVVISPSFDEAREYLRVRGVTGRFVVTGDRTWTFRGTAGTEWAITRTKLVPPVEVKAS